MWFYGFSDKTKVINKNGELTKVINNETNYEEVQLLGLKLESNNQVSSHTFVQFAINTCTITA